jgi:thioredoxin reductase
VGEHDAIITGSGPNGAAAGIHARPRGSLNIVLEGRATGVSFA